MNELVPLITGFALGLVLGAVRPSVRWWIGAPLAASLGVMATVITGEFETSWAFVLIDIPLVVLAIAVAGCGNDELIGRYCNYGAVSKSQYDACVDHVTVDDVNRALDRGSPAAEFAEDCDGSPSSYSDREPVCELAPEPGDY
jgi:hypothetical protein